MKKFAFTTILLLSLLFSCLFFGGCSEGVLTEISAVSDFLSEGGTEEKPPEAEIGAEREGEEATEEETERSHSQTIERASEEIESGSEEGSESEDPPPSEEGEREEETKGVFRYEPPASPTSEYTAACARTAVNVRKGPGTNYALITLLRAGDSLPYLWREGGWLAVWTGERVGYLSGEYAYLATTSPALEEVIRAGLDKLGTPYEWGAPRLLTDRGGINPYFTGKSFDCSSFVQYCYYVGAGIKLGNYTGSQADHTVGERITSYDDLRRGDFYFTGSGTISHVVIYLGGGYLLQTYSANGGPVSVTTDARWRSKFLSARRPDLTVTDQFG